MPIIASERFEPNEEDDNSATYHVAMQDFLRKQRTTRWGVSVKTQVFTVSWSSFQFEIYISGNLPGVNSVVILLRNNETWRVKVKVDLNILGESLMSCLNHVIHPSGSVMVGCLGHHRCNTKDLLDQNGTLNIRLKVQVIDEMVSGGASKILKKLEEVTEELQDTKGQLGYLHQRLEVMNYKIDSFVEDWKVRNYISVA